MRVTVKKLKNNNKKIEYKSLTFVKALSEGIRNIFIITVLLT